MITNTECYEVLVPEKGIKKKLLLETEIKQTHLQRTSIFSSWMMNLLNNHLNKHVSWSVKVVYTEFNPVKDVCCLLAEEKNTERIFVCNLHTPSLSICIYFVPLSSPLNLYSLPVLWFQSWSTTPPFPPWYSWLLPWLCSFSKDLFL